MGRAASGRAAFVVAALLFVAPPSPADEGAPERGTASVGEARALFRLGVEMAGQERWAEAERLFARSDALVPRPSNAFNRALALYRLGRLREMLTELERFLARSDPERDAADRRTAGQLQSEGTARLASMQLHVVPANASVRFDALAVPVENGEARLEADPGSHTLIAEAKGHATVRRDLALASGEHLDVELALPVLAAPDGLVPAVAPVASPSLAPTAEALRAAPVPAGAIVLASAGAASLLAAATLGILATHLDSNLSSRCKGGCPANERDSVNAEQDRMWHFAVASDVLGATGLLLAGGGVTWFLATRHSTVPAPRASARLGPRWVSFSVDF